MSFKMIYDERNRQNIAKLADNTKIATLKWYQYCIDNQIQILIYETIRTVTQQKQNVAKGASKTMKSYHLVGQALDFVPVDKNGKALWNGYNASNIQKAFTYARKLGFELGHDWGWDSPHLQYNFKGYGTDTFGKIKVDMNIKSNKDGALSMSEYQELKKEIEELRKQLNNVEKQPSSWAKESWSWGIKEGITDGEKPKGVPTREQFVSMLHRFYKNFIKK